MRRLPRQPSTKRRDVPHDEVFVKHVNEDRERSIEPLLKSALRAHAAEAPAGRCLDPERAAAWADGALTAHDRTAAEAHVASCAECQMLLAALARTGPPAAAHRWFRRPRMAWLAPLTAAAAAVLVWTLVPSSMRTTPAEQTIAQPDAVATASNAPLPATIEPPAFGASRAPNVTPPPAAAAAAPRVDRQNERREALAKTPPDPAAK